MVMEAQRSKLFHKRLHTNIKALFQEIINGDKPFTNG